MMGRGFFTLIAIILTSCLLAGVTDSNAVKEPFNLSYPQRAAIASSLLPGSGQVMNHQAWKAPLAWGIMAGAGYFVYINQSSFDRLSLAIDFRYDNDPSTIDEFDGLYTTNQLFSLQNDYRRSRDYAVLGLAGTYLFQVLEAYAAAHLVDFDVSRNLSLRLSPATLPQSLIGAKMTLSWH
ncbi:MAG: DUF5683 domain-containing protein [Schleiferiaceae bacterium]|jgi:hypothetical protein|nr:hypothetical protein [Flavobacteriales bacterium]MDG1005384.1 DUF5683 domain-containing protein [Schleiferiaceae bacterium]MDG1220665.1 DUF5683 domain-containing protein [Schleiferiaceae bacterium]MDO7566282.1 DUF5683 domain-containing protein [Schleiferiaceae bacterium]MDO7583403.1 DUF5683 domain-containing protein [Schleiferiaceae bacterium]